MAKIMIVEDEAIVAMSVRSKLRSLGYEVCDLVSRAEDALENVAIEKPDLIIMDIGLSGRMNGIDAAREIRHHSAAPIIFTTGYFDEELAKEITSISASWLLQKPFGPEDIEQLVAEALLQRGTNTHK